MPPAFWKVKAQVKVEMAQTESSLKLNLDLCLACSLMPC